MQRNVVIAYVLTFLKNSWFWLGIWVFYYLKFTNYAGIGLIETTVIFAVTLGEVPTGVIADLFGKKRTITISFVLITLAMFMLAFAASLLWLVIAIFILGIGSSFYSGALDALVYDSLLQIQEEKKFHKVISNMTSLSLVAPAVCGVIGGFLYLVQPNLPYILTAAFYLVGIPLTFLLSEPNVEKSGESIRNFVNQTYLGMKELFKTRFLAEQTVLLVSTGAISVICLEMLNDFLGVEFGFKPAQLAIVWSILYILCALISSATVYLRKYISYEKLAILVGVCIGITLIISPVGGIILGGLTLSLRAFFQTMYQNVSSVLINDRIDSQYRVTALSSFNLLKNIPYVFTAYFLGMFADRFSATRLAVILGIALLIFLIPQGFLYAKRKAL